MPYKDPEKARQNSRERAARWRQRHPEADKAARKRCYDAHRIERCAASLKWYYENKTHVLNRLFGYQLKKRYGLTPEQFAVLGNACAICGATVDPRAMNGKKFRLSVDHDHATGKVRGLLCGSCNCGIGYFKHDEALMRQAIAYLERTR